MVVRFGVVFVVVGVAAGLSAAPVQRLASDAGTTYLQALDDQDWGRPITSGDLDGDGFDEIIVSASESFGGVLSQVFVIRGGPGLQAAGTVDLAAHPVDQIILGAALDDDLGASMATGDVDGDGVDDLLLCAPTASPPGLAYAGIAYLILGGPEFFSSNTRDLSVTTNWDLRFYGPVAGGDMGGASIFGGFDTFGAAIGNLNGDIYGDIVLGVHLATGSASGSGRAYVMFGRADIVGNFTIPLGSPPSFVTRINGVGTEDELGTVVLTGDLTGDGIDELIMPNEFFSQGIFTTEGAVHILRGRTTWPATINLSTSTDIRLLGDFNYDSLGTTAVVGDFNNDGIVDLAAAAPGADADTPTTQRGDGFIYGLFGATGYQTGTYLIDYATATPDFLIIGDFEQNLGDTLAAGDFNGDGVADIAAGERFGGGSSRGVVEVVFGGSAIGDAVYTANVNTDLRITGTEPSDRAAFWLASSDVNNDGLDEIVFGTPFDHAQDGVIWMYSHATGDFDHDHDLDLYDYAGFQACAAGTAVPTGCFVFDFDTDGDVDLLDLAELVAGMNGPAQ